MSVHTRLLAHASVLLLLSIVAEPATAQSIGGSLQSEFVIVTANRVSGDPAVNGLVSRAIPAGFYYKTFFGPPKRWMKYERFIRKAAGLGPAPTFLPVTVATTCGSGNRRFTRSGWLAGAEVGKMYDQ